MVSKVLDILGLGPREKNEAMPEDNKEDVTDVNPNAAGDDQDVLPEGDDLDNILLADLIARGKIDPSAIKKADVADDGPTFAGFKKPKNWDDMEPNDQLEWITEQNLAHTQKAVDKAVKETEDRILSRIAPMSRDRVIQDIESLCDPEYAPFAKKALEETERMFGGKPATQISKAERALVAERAELMYLRSKGSGPNVVESEEVPRTGADPAVLKYMREYNAARPGKPLNYEKAKARYTQSKELAW